MKVRIICKKENYDCYSKMLEDGGFIISDDYDLILKEKESFENYINVKNDGFISKIFIDDIYTIESFGHKIYINTKEKKYLVNQKLYELESLLHEKGFIRINKSQILNLNKMLKMKPLINYRIKIILTNGSSVYVSRSYYYNFKNKINF